MSVAQEKITEAGKTSAAGSASEIPLGRPKRTRVAKKVVLEKGGGFGNRIKATYMGAVKHRSPFLPDGFISAFVVGKSGTGKSCLVREMIPQLSHLCSVLVCTSKTDDPVYIGVRDWCESTPIEVGPLDESEKDMERRKKEGGEAVEAETKLARLSLAPPASYQTSEGLVPDTRKFMPPHLMDPTASAAGGGPQCAPVEEEDGEETIRYDEAHTVEEAKHFRALHKMQRKPGCYMLVVFDDWAPSRAGAANPFVCFQDDCSSKLRGDHAHVISVSQAPVMTSNRTRNNSTVFAFFPMIDDTAKGMAARAFASITSRPPEAFLELYSMICRVPYSYVFATGGSMGGRVFINLPDGKHDGLVEVFPKTEVSEETITNDDRVIEMVETIVNLSASSSPMARYQLGRANEALHDYAVFLARKNNVDVKVIEDIIHEAFHLGGTSSSAPAATKGRGKGKVPATVVE
jgi:hypothetical protein